MDRYTINKIAEFLESNEWDDPITNVKVYYNMEGDWVLSYEQDDQKKLITIDFID